MLEKPEQGLSYAAELGDLVDGEPDRRLHAPVGILLQTVADLDEANRRTDDELASPGLLVARRERPLAQEVELVLVEAALQPPQQPVVALARRIDSLLIDQQRVDDAAHLDELLPVAAIAREPRDLPGRHRADLAEADLGHHALEAGARGPARRRAAEVLVDDLDLGPAQLHEPVAHGVLQHLALAVVLNLMGRRLADIEHRLARLVPCGNLLSAHRRRSPAAARCRRRGRPTDGSSGR